MKNPDSYLQIKNFKSGGQDIKPSNNLTIYIKKFLMLCSFLNFLYTYISNIKKQLCLKTITFLI